MAPCTPAWPNTLQYILANERARSASERVRASARRPRPVHFPVSRCRRYGPNHVAWVDVLDVLALELFPEQVPQVRPDVPQHGIARQVGGNGPVEDVLSGALCHAHDAMTLPLQDAVANEREREMGER